MRLRSDELERFLVQVQRRLCALEGSAQANLVRDRQHEQQLRAVFTELAALREYLHQRSPESLDSTTNSLTIQEELDRR